MDNVVTPYEAAVISRLAYQRSRLGYRYTHPEDQAETPAPSEDSWDQAPIIILPAGWGLEKDLIRPSTYGLSVTLAKKRSSKQLIFAIRGTDNLRNLYYDLKGIMGEGAGDEQDRETPRTDTMVGEIVHIFQQNYLDEYHRSGWRLTLTGHSMGGFLANLVLLRLMKIRPELNDRLHSISFDAPGIGSFYSNRLNGENKYCQRPESLELVTNYISRLNYVNCCQPHVEKLVQFWLPRRELDDQDRNLANQARDRQERGSIMARAASQASTGVRGIFAASGKACIGSIADLADVIGVSLFRSFKDTLWAHAGENIILAFNPRTGMPYKKTEPIPAGFPTLRGHLSRELLHNLSALFSEPTGDLIERALGERIAVNRELAEDSNHTRCHFNIRHFFMLATTATLLFFGSNYFGAGNTFFIGSLSIFQFVSTYLSSWLTQNINHASSIIVCNRSFGNAATDVGRCPIVSRAIEPLLGSSRCLLETVDSGFYREFFKLYSFHQMSSFLGMISIILVSDPTIHSCIMLGLLIPLTPLIFAYINNERLKEGIRKVYQDQTGQYIRGKFALFDHRLREDPKKFENHHIPKMIRG